MTTAAPDTATPISTETSSGRLRAVAAADPDLVAIRADETSLTYAQLDCAVDELAARIVGDLGAGDQRVALQALGTIPMTVGTLGIARAGKVSVPVDPTAPAERTQVILDDVGANLLLTDLDPPLEVSGVTVAHPLRHRADPPAGGVDEPSGPLASIVFTSGSTGVPKGIMAPTRNRTGLRYRELPLGAVPERARVGAVTAGTVGFSEVIPHFAVQAGCTLDAFEVRRHGLAGIGDWVHRSGILAFATVPTVIRFLLPSLRDDEVFTDLRHVLLTGETTTWEDVAALRPHLHPDALIHNSFGLTETGGISSFSVDATEPVGTGPLPAGLPVSGVRVEITGEDGRPVPVGEAGEIVVESATCALGYWRRPDLTASVFTELAEGRTRVRTGDGGRWRPDGMLEHLGRLDHVVKVNGNRIELGDVEAALRSVPGVAAAAAAAYDDDAGSTRLVAFAMTGPGADVDSWALRAAMARRVPGSMLPDRIHVVDALPQLPNGKVDRRQLPDVDRAIGHRPEPERAMGPVEAAIAAIWEEILGTGSVGLDDDFFELGGDSIRASRAFIELEHRLGLVRPVSMIIEASTPRRLAAAVGAEPGDTGLLLPVRTEGTKPPLFVVHDGIGGVFYATELADHLGPDRPVYGLQPTLLLGDDFDCASFEELAARYVAAVRRVQLHGPYHFYGASLGGSIAFEMSRQLEAAGETVELLAMGDSSSPWLTTTSRAAMRWRELRDVPFGTALRRGAVHGVNLGRRLRDGTRQRKTTAALRSAARSGDPVPVDPSRPDEVVLRRAGALLHRYRPTAGLAAPLLMFRATLPPAGPRAIWRGDHGWGPWVAGDVRVVPLDFTHGEFSHGPCVSAIGEALRETLG